MHRRPAPRARRAEATASHRFIAAVPSRSRAARPNVTRCSATGLGRSRASAQKERRRGGVEGGVQGGVARARRYWRPPDARRFLVFFCLKGDGAHWRISHFQKHNNGPVLLCFVMAACDHRMGRSRSCGWPVVRDVRGVSTRVAASARASARRPHGMTAVGCGPETRACRSRTTIVLASSFWSVVSDHFASSCA